MTTSGRFASKASEQEDKLKWYALVKGDEWANDQNLGMIFK